MLFFQSLIFRVFSKMGNKNKRQHRTIHIPKRNAKYMKYKIKSESVLYIIIMKIMFHTGDV